MSQEQVEAFFKKSLELREEYLSFSNEDRDMFDALIKEDMTKQKPIGSEKHEVFPIEEKKEE